MRLERLVAAALVFGCALTLSACGAGTVADMWPHWAGGEPAGLPPRPGQPGYDEFIAHGQPDQNQAAGPAAPAGATATIADQKSAAQPQKPPAYAEPQVQDRSETEPLPEPVERPASDSGVVRGGLY